MSKKTPKWFKDAIKKHGELDKQYKQREEEFSRFLTLLVGRQPGITEDAIYFGSHFLAGKKELKEKLEQWWKDNPQVDRQIFTFEYYKEPAQTIYHKNGITTYAPLSFCMTTLLLMYKANREGRLYTDKICIQKLDGQKVKLKLDLEDQKAILERACFWKSFPKDKTTFLEYIEELAK